MSYIFEKHSVEKIEITRVKKSFMKYSHFVNVRLDKPNCGICEKAFNLEDDTNLAFITGKVNSLICDSCTEIAINGGAEEISF